MVRNAEEEHRSDDRYRVYKEDDDQTVNNEVYFSIKTVARDEAARSWQDSGPIGTSGTYRSTKHCTSQHLCSALRLQYNYANKPTAACISHPRASTIRLHSRKRKRRTLTTSNSDIAEKGCGETWPRLLPARQTQRFTGRAVFPSRAVGFWTVTVGHQPLHTHTATVSILTAKVC